MMIDKPICLVVFICGTYINILHNPTFLNPGDPKIRKKENRQYYIGVSGSFLSGSFRREELLRRLKEKGAVNDFEIKMLAR